MNLKESKEGVYRNIQRKERIEGNDVIILLKIRSNSKYVYTSHITILILCNQSFEGMVWSLMLLENNQPIRNEKFQNMKLYQL